MCFCDVRLNQGRTEFAVARNADHLGGHEKADGAAQSCVGDIAGQ